MLAGWNPETERHAKEILYRCLEDLGATKAALYLTGQEGHFELATQYGFGRRDTLLAEVRGGHPFWDLIRRKRSFPAFVNDLKEIPQLREILEGAGTARVLTIPLVVGDRLAGFVDVRDKGRRQPFVAGDRQIAKQIGDALVHFLAESGWAEAAPEEESSTTGEFSPAPPESAGREMALHHDLVTQVAELTVTLAGLPGVAGLALTVTDGQDVRLHLHRRAPMDHLQREALAKHQQQRLEEDGVRVREPSTWNWSEQEGLSEREAEEIRTIMVVDGPPVWVMLSCLSAGGPTTAESVVQIAAQHTRLLRRLLDHQRASRHRASTLLEPPESSFPHLRQHSQGVAELAAHMAVLLGLSEEEEEAVALAAYLHDVGMRELDYQRLYRMGSPGDVERRQYQRHPALGARMAEHAGFPRHITQAILHHHERWDGTGYPHRVAGRDVPLASRIIHLAEVFDVLTSATSYRRPVSREAALAILRAEAGHQFDPDLLPVLNRAVSE
jgi:putative nucleotidyltransferase with HDIG domain